MLNKVHWSDNRIYRSGSDFEVLEFYIEGLSNSNHLDLLLGYFSSSAINVLSLGFAKFLASGGTVRLVVNDVLSESDKNAIIKGQSGERLNIAFDLSNIVGIKEILDEYGTHFFECLAWLIYQNRIQIKIIKPKGKQGISHYKSGIFTDGQNDVGFKGSCNFTSYGLLENLEEADIYLNWENGRSHRWFKGQKEFFEAIYAEQLDFIEYLDASDVNVAIRQSFGNKDLNDLLISERELIEQKKALISNPKIRNVLNRITSDILTYNNTPRFPFDGQARPYQIEAYQNWVNNNCKGIFAMATGTGKTITSLNCLLNEYQKSNEKVYHALILVPTLTLVSQWVKEASKFNFKEIIIVSSKTDWETELSTKLSAAKRIPISFIIICTYQSFIKDKFQKQIKRLPLDTLFIADEGHNIATPNIINKLHNFPLKKRIGLSATPKRVYDEEGTLAMQSFFDDKEPYTFSFSMEKAIEDGILCKYYYYPHIIQLTTDEFEEYLVLSKKIAKLAHTQKEEMSDMLEKLLLQRKRIIHKASNKLEITKKILQQQFQEKGDLKYTFVYVPEGISEEVSEDGQDGNENIKIIDLYSREIGLINENIRVNKFISGMQNRDEILKQFQNGDIDIIASMKCLDEGVDIPRAECAIFCSSTGNPRQFIQRRGRILRKHPDKHLATIHDLVVIPDYEYLKGDSETFQTEKKLVQKELERVMYFASLAINPYFTENVFSEVCRFYNLNIYTILNELKTV